jgi:hypothetical protein
MKMGMSTFCKGIPFETLFLAFHPIGFHPERGLFQEPHFGERL